MGLLSEDNRDCVIVRADIVAGESRWNLVVPVDADSGQALDGAIQKLIKAAGDPNVPHTVLRVKAHHPNLPHRAHSFISEAEFNKSPKELTHFGRHWPASPGANPWG
jgi:hypothetical protein